MTVDVDDIRVGDGDHAVHFYERESELAEIVGGYLTTAAEEGAAAIVIATPRHLSRFEAELLAAGVDVVAWHERGALVMLDAATTLQTLMPGGRLDGEAFRETIGTVVRRASAVGTSVRAYGEMVALLWERGDVGGAIELEKLWNELQDEIDFSLLCAYRSQLTSELGHVDALGEVCRLHSKVLRVPARAAVDPPRLADRVSGWFSSGDEAPSEARRFVVEALRRWGQAGTSLDDAKLIVSELATNAVVHARSSFSVVVSRDDSRMRLSVSDASPAEPCLRQPTPRADRGRGLPLVEVLADRWGVDLTEAGKTVWAELPR